MTNEDVGQGAVSGPRGHTRATVTHAYGWRRDAYNRNEVGKQDYPKDEKFKGVPPVHVQGVT